MRRCNLLLIPIVIVLSGCATQPFTGNSVCVQAAEYARTMAVLRDAGISPTQLDEYAVKTKLMLFPTGAIQRAVFTMGGTPDKAAVRVYKACTDNGWKSLPEKMRDQTGQLRFAYSMNASSKGTSLVAVALPQDRAPLQLRFTWTVSE